MELKDDKQRGYTSNRPAGRPEKYKRKIKQRTFGNQVMTKDKVVTKGPSGVKKTVVKSYAPKVSSKPQSSNKSMDLQGSYYRKPITATREELLIKPSYSSSRRWYLDEPGDMGYDPYEISISSKKTAGSEKSTRGESAPSSKGGESKQVVNKSKSSEASSTPKQKTTKSFYSKRTSEGKVMGRERTTSSGFTSKAKIKTKSVKTPKVSSPRYF